MANINFTADQLVTINNALVAAIEFNGTELDEWDIDGDCETSTRLKAQRDEYLATYNVVQTALAATA
jgi:hypothetical protein